MLAQMRQESFIDWFMGVYTFFHAQHIAVQILIIALLTAITVGAIVLAFYVVKLVFQLLFWLIKALFNLLKNIGGKKEPQPASSTQPTQVALATATVIPAQVIQATPVVAPVVAQKLHCPNCGAEFTAEMMALIKQKTETFCESCGAKLKI
jgi:DNA-directed RNA polymerase subunit RPC12/RpoP